MNPTFQGSLYRGYECFPIFFLLDLRHIHRILKQFSHTTHKKVPEQSAMVLARTGTPCLPLWPILAVLLASSAAVAQQTAAGMCNSTLLAVGTFTDITYIDPPVSGEGVTLLNLTLCTNRNGTLSATLDQDRLIPVTDTGQNPSYCDQYDESTIICSSGVENGTATFLNIDEPTDVGLVFDLGVESPTHIEVLSNGIVATAHYGASSFLSFDASSDPSDSVVTSITIPEGNATIDLGDAERQAAPHPHQVREVAEGEVLIPDLGSDAVYQYSVAPDGALTWAGVTNVPAGSGPRHVAVGQGGKVYLVAELTLQVLELGTTCTEGAEGAARGVCSTKDIPKTSDNSTFTSGAAIRVSKDHKFVYVSLRVQEETPDLGAIVGYELGLDGSLGEWVGTWPSGGQQPRDFNLVEVPGFKEVFVVGNRKSNNVVVFDRDEATGTMGEQLAVIAVNSPVSILAIEKLGGVSSGADAPGPAGPGFAGAPVAGPVDADDENTADQDDGDASGPSPAAADSTAREASACPAGQSASESGDCDEAPVTALAAATAADFFLFAIAVAVNVLIVV